MRLLQALAKDARVLVRHRVLLVALLAYPFLLALVLGGAFAEPPARLDLAIVDRDAGGGELVVGDERLDSRALAERLGAIADVRSVPDQTRALALLRQGEVDAVLVVPRGFVEDVATLGRGGTLRVVVDESDPVRAQVTQAALAGAIDRFSEQVVRAKIDEVLALLNLTARGGTTSVAGVPVDVLGLEAARARVDEVRATLDPDSPEARKLREVAFFLEFASGFLANADAYLRTTAAPVTLQAEGLAARDPPLVAIALPGAIVLGVFWTGALAASLLVARDAETGVARRLAAAPTPRALLAASKALVALLAALVPAAILLMLGYLALDAVVADPLATLATLALASLAAAALGGLAAALARSSAASGLVVVLALLPMLVLGGLFYPVAYMPSFVQAVARVLPVTLATDALRGAMVRGSPASELLPAWGGLALVALALAAAAASVSARARS